MKPLQAAFLVMATWAIPAVGLARSPTPDEALKQATSVVLVEWAYHETEIHSFVKEVWRADPDITTVPAVGSEYGRATSASSSQIRAKEGVAIVFEFSANRSPELPATFRVPVNEKGRVPLFQKEILPLDDIKMKTYDPMDKVPMTVGEVRSKVKKANRENAGAVPARSIAGKPGQ